MDSSLTGEDAHREFTCESRWVMLDYTEELSEIVSGAGMR